ncbi:hypothetical protein D3C72_1647870 [compost metagenome]
MHVGIHRDQDLARGGLNARGHGGRLAVVAAEAHHLGARIGLGDAFEHLVRAVGGAVVDVDDLVGAPERRHRIRQLLMERPEVVLLVVDGQKHRQLVAAGGGCHVEVGEAGFGQGHRGLPPARAMSLVIPGGARALNPAIDR